MHHWLRDYPDFLEFFIGKCFTEPHSTKPIEDAIGWALETTPEVLADHDAGIDLPIGGDFRELCGRVRCPVLVMHGDEDALHSHAQGRGARRGDGRAARHAPGLRTLSAGAGSGGGQPARSRVRGAAAVIVRAAATREQSRARYPDEEGFVERDGVRVFYEVYGDAPTTFLLFPTSPISHSRLWKAQIPYLSRHFRVVTFDPRGNGRSDRPDDAEAYSYWEIMKDGRAVLEATGTEGALLGGLCDGGGYALMLAATDPAVALGVAAISPSVPRLTPGIRTTAAFRPPSRSTRTRAGPSGTSTTGGATSAGSSSSSSRKQLPEPHSTKQIEDCVRWGLDGGVESLVLADEEAPPPFASARRRAICVARVRCPVLVSTASSTTARRASARSRSRSSRVGRSSGSRARATCRRRATR